MIQSRDGEAISRDLAQIHWAAYERALTRAAHTDVTHDRVTSRLDIELTPAEELLIGRGLHDAVHAARHVFQATLTPAYNAAVERATGRFVSRRTSHTDLHARVTTETFLLAPVAHPPA